MPSIKLSIAVDAGVHAGMVRRASAMGRPVEFYARQLLMGAYADRCAREPGLRGPILEPVAALPAPAEDAVPDGLRSYSKRWPPALVDELTRLWAAGHTARQCGDALGKSKAAVEQFAFHHRDLCPKRKRR